MHAASEPFDLSAVAETGERSANEMRNLDWVTLIVALADLVLKYMEMRRARRDNDGPDRDDHWFAFGGRVGLASRSGLTKYSRKIFLNYIFLKEIFITLRNLRVI